MSLEPEKGAQVRLAAQTGPQTRRVGPWDSACKLTFHLGHVARQMVSCNHVTGSQSSPPTLSH